MANLFVHRQFNFGRGVNMAQSMRVKEFIEEVCCQIESKKAHGLLTNELIAHIEDQKLAYMNEGMDENSAEERAIFQMGDPAAVGENFNQVHRHKLEWVGPAANIIMWIIAGGIFLSGVITGGAIGYAMFLANTGIVIAVITGISIMAFGFMVALVFVSICKLISHEIFYYGLIKDYKRKKKKGEIYAKKY